MISFREGQVRSGVGGRAAAAALALAIAAMPAAAQIEVDPRPEAAGGGELAELTVLDGVAQLPLEDAVRLALARNLSLVVERYRLTESSFRLAETYGIYDLNATADLVAFEDTSPSASQIDGADVGITENQRVDLGLSQLFSSGGVASMDFNNSRFSTNSTFATLDPSFRLDLDLSFTQPLLRNRGRGATERVIRVARINKDISSTTFEAQVITVLQQVEDSYWTLVEAREQLRVAEESLELAQRLHEQNRIRVEVGTLAPLELVQSEAGVATREEQIIRGEAAVGDAEDSLRQLLNVPPGAAWSTPFKTVTDPETEHVEIDLEQAMATALERRPDLRSSRLELENLELDVAYFENQKLPRLDLTATYGFNGLGGDLTERDFFTGEILNQAAGGYGDALEQIQGLDFEGWRVAVNLAYPIQNRGGKARVALAEVSVDRLVADLANLELTAMTQVRRLARAVETAAKALESARVSRRLEERNLEAEQKRYDNGMSTSFQVLQIQEDLTEARQREVNAITGYRKALVLFYQATGELMERNGVEIVEPEA